MMLKSAVQGSSWSSIAALVSAGVAFGFAALSIRFLGLEIAGFAQAVTALLSLAVSVGGLGFNIALTKLLGAALAENDHDSFARTYWTAAISLMVLALGAGVAVIAYRVEILRWAKVSGGGAGATAFLCLTAGTQVLNQLQMCLQAGFGAHRRFDAAAMLSVGSQLLTNGVNLVVLALVPTLTAYGIVSFGCAVVGTISGLVGLRKVHGAPLPIRCTVHTWRALWSEGRWAYAGNLVQLLCAGADRVVIVAIGGASALPLYNIARRCYELVHSLLNQAMAFLFPLLSREGAKGAEVAARIEARLIWFVTIFAAECYVLVLGLGPWALHVVLGKDLGSEFSRLLTIFSVIGLIHALTVVPYLLNYAVGRANINFALSLVAGLTSLPAMWLLGRTYGVDYAVYGQAGIAVASLVFLFLQGTPPSVPGLLRLLAPAFLPVALFVPAVALVVAIGAASAPPWVALTAGLFTALLYLPLLFLLEKYRAGGRFRLETLASALESSVLHRAAPRLCRLSCTYLRA